VSFVTCRHAMCWGQLCLLGSWLSSVVVVFGRGNEFDDVFVCVFRIVSFLLVSFLHKLDLQLWFFRFSALCGSGLGITRCPSSRLMSLINIDSL